MRSEFALSASVRRSLHVIATAVDKSPQQIEFSHDSKYLYWLAKPVAGGENCLWRMELEDGSIECVIEAGSVANPADGKPVPLHSYILYPDASTILLHTLPPARFSPRGSLILFDVETKLPRLLAESTLPQFHPTFSPDGARVGLVRGSDLYVIDTATGQEQRLTTDGTATLLNGRYGWVYEEELHLTNGFSFSPDGKSIACVQQDESMVPLRSLTRYELLQPDAQAIRYPRAGEPNPTARLRLVDLETGSENWTDVGDGNEYLAGFHWLPSSLGLLIQCLNRSQTVLSLDWVSRDGSQRKTVLTERNRRWVSHVPNLKTLANDRFLWPSERSGRQRWYVGSCNGIPLKAVTPTGPECGELYSLSGGVAMYQAVRSHPWNRAVAKWNVGEKQPIWITPDSGWADATVAPDLRSYTTTVSNHRTPPVVTVHTERLTVALPAAPSVAPDKRTARSSWEFTWLPGADGEPLAARILRPTRIKGNQKYPVLMCVYGGPGSQMVVDRWGGPRSAWHGLLADMGIGVVVVDNRGTGGRGRAFKQVTVRRLGDLESRDQVAAARALRTVDWVDAKRVGIWGWSYGGFMALSCILRAPGLFKAGIAVAPVTQWELYDSIYTERYMGTPKENPDGYTQNSPLTHAAKLKGRLLLIHGTADDNVHFHNSARFAAALQKANIPFDTMFYPGKAHGLDGVQEHLYTLFTTFLLKNL